MHDIACMHAPADFENMYAHSGFSYALFCVLLFDPVAKFKVATYMQRMQCTIAIMIRVITLDYARQKPKLAIMHVYRELTPVICLPTLLTSLSTYSPEPRQFKLDGFTDPFSQL